MICRVWATSLHELKWGDWLGGVGVLVLACWCCKQFVDVGWLLVSDGPLLVCCVLGRLKPELQRVVEYWRVERLDAESNSKMVGCRWKVG